MRIVQLGPLPPPHGGVSTNLLAINELLLREGHGSTLIAITGSSRTDDLPNAVKPRSSGRLLYLLLTLKFDVVHFHIGGDFNLRLAVLAFVCGLLPGKRSVVTFHSGGFAREHAETARPFSLRGSAFRSLDLVIGVNEQMLGMFRAYGVKENRMRLILPFALSQPDPSTAIPPELSDFAASHTPFLLSVGGLEPEYSHLLSIDAMEKVLAKAPEAGLMIIGSGSLDAEIRANIAARPYADSVRLVNDVEHSVLLHLIARANALVRLTRYDGDAISIREALFLGTPVVATDTGLRPDGVSLVPMDASAADVADAVAAAGPRCDDPPNASDRDVNTRKVLDAYRSLLEN